jgi:hypothetical protein
MSVPPLKNFTLGYFLIIFFSSITVLGAKYFLFSIFIKIFFGLIFFNKDIVFFSLSLN